MMPSPAPPLVSVSIITYNQVSMIGRALDSVLAQQTDFQFEVIVGDDCSDDGTQDVIRDYAARYPDTIIPIYHPHRYDEPIAGRTNNVTNLRACRGKYTAMLDGDDYWTDPLKLQRQVDRLEANPELVMCVHDSVTTTLNERGEEVAPRGLYSNWGVHHAEGRYTHADIASYGDLRFQIGTILFRTGVYGEFPEWFFQIGPADVALMLLISQRGQVYYDPHPQAVYTITQRSFSGEYGRTYHYLRHVQRDFKIFKEHFPAVRNSKRFEFNLTHNRFKLLKMSLRRGRVDWAAWCFYKIVRHNPGFFPREVKKFVAGRISTGGSAFTTTTLPEGKTNA